MVHFVCFGTINSFSVAFATIRDDLHASRPIIGATPALASFTMLAVSSLAGRLATRFGVGRMLGAGGVMLSAGLVLASRSRSALELYLSFGILLGLGVGCCFVPSLMAVASASSEETRGRRLGIAAAGSGVGTMVLAPVASILIGSLGWRTGFCVLATQGAALVVAGILVGALRETRTYWQRASRVRLGRGFGSLYASVLTAGVAYYVPFVYLVPLAMSRGLSRTHGAYVLLALGVANTVGRGAAGFLGDRYRRTHVYNFSLLMMAVAVAGLAVDAPLALWLASIAFGGAAGIFIGTLPAVADDLRLNGGVGTLTGPVYTALALGALAGPVAGGAVADSIGYSLMLLIAGAIAASGYVGARLAFSRSTVPTEPACRHVY